MSDLGRRVDRVERRLEGVEAGVVELNTRIDGLGDDMRQRFRLLNERVAGLAA